MDDSFDISQLRPWSYGYVAENKPRSATKILVTPTEKLTFLDGQIKSNPTVVESQGVDSQGINYSVSATADNVIVAEWLRGTNSGTRTAPDVRRGEQVQIYRYGDTDTYYWVSMGFDDHLRKGETYTRTFSATLDESVDGTKSGNCYELTVSTHDKIISLKTSKVNGEKAKYGFQIDTGNGKIILNDDIGNQVEIDSVNALILLINAQKAAISINQKNIAINAPDSFALKAVNNIAIQCTTFTLQATTANITADTTNVKTTLKQTGDVTVTGNTVFNGTLKVTDSCTFGGGVSVTGDMGVSGAITCKKLTSEQPIVAPNV